MSALEALAPSYALIARATSPVRTSDHLSDADSDASSDFDIDPDDFLDFLDSESEPEEEATAPPEPKSAPGRRGSTALAQASELASDEELRGLIEKKLSFHGLEPERMKSKKVRKAINTVVAASNRRQSLRRGSSAKTLLSERSDVAAACSKDQGRSHQTRYVWERLRRCTQACASVLMSGSSLAPPPRLSSDAVVRGIIEGVGPSRDLLLVRSLSDDHTVSASELYLTAAAASDGDGDGVKPPRMNELTILLHQQLYLYPSSPSGIPLLGLEGEEEEVVEEVKVMKKYVSRPIDHASCVRFSRGRGQGGDGKQWNKTVAAQKVLYYLLISFS